MSKKVYANTLAIVNMIKCLEAGSTIAEITQEAGLHVTTVRRWVNHFRRAGMCYIMAYDADVMGRPRARVYKLGQGKDLKYVPFTEQERKARYKAKIKARKFLRVLHAA